MKPEWLGSMRWGGEGGEEDWVSSGTRERAMRISQDTQRKSILIQCRELGIAHCCQAAAGLRVLLDQGLDRNWAS